jgi:transcriptional regulator with XRE-family HTH domain
MTVVIGDRLREMREEKKLSQGDIEKRTGLLRCYISRVENGHTVPAIETLEKLARALEGNEAHQDSQHHAGASS